MLRPAFLLWLMVLGGAAQAQIAEPWSPFRSGAVNFLVKKDTGAWLDGYSLKPGRIENADSVWYSNPVQGNQGLYGNAAYYGVNYAFYMAPEFSLVGEKVRYEARWHCFRIVRPSGLMGSGGTFGTYIMQDTTRFYPGAKAVGDTAIAFTYTTINNFQIAAQNQLRYATVTALYAATVDGRPDSVREVTEQGNNRVWLWARRAGLIKAYTLYNSDTNARRYLTAELRSRIRVRSPRSWIDIRPGDRFDNNCGYYHQSVDPGTGHAAQLSDNYYTITIDAAAWAPDSSLLHLRGWQKSLTSRYNEQSTPGSHPYGNGFLHEELDSLYADFDLYPFALAELDSFTAFRNGITLAMARDSTWSLTGKVRYFPGTLSCYAPGQPASIGQTWTTVTGGPSDHTETGTTLLYYQTQRFGTYGSPYYFQVTATRPTLARAIQAVPLPAADHVTLAGAEGYGFRLQTLAGKTLRAGHLPETGVLDRQSLPPGVYLLYLSRTSGREDRPVRLVFE